MTDVLDPRLQIGANGGPPLDEPEPADIAPRHLQIAWRSLRAVCAVTGEHDPNTVKLKKQGVEAMSLRNLWLWAMAPHIPNNVLAKISQLNRKTVTTYVQQVERHAERNGLLRTFCDQIADMVEPIPGIVDDSAEALADMAVEAALDRVKTAAAVLEKSAPIVSAPRLARQAYRTAT